MRINSVPRTCKLMTAALKDLTRKTAHHLVVNLIIRVVHAKGEKALVSEIDASVKNRWKFWRWLKEKVETGLCLARFMSPVVSSVNNVDMKIATSIPSAIAKVSPASVLLTTLRIFLGVPADRNGLSFVHIPNCEISGQSAQI